MRRSAVAGIPLGALILTFAVVLVAPARRVLGDKPSLLFDGKTLNGWTTLAGKPVTRGWEVVDGMIHLKRERPRAGHIISTRQFGDFRLAFEWKIAAGGNSGVKYRVRSYSGRIRGCEYQILDDAGYRWHLPPRKRTGSLYDLYEPTEAKQLLPAGQFNSGCIVVRGSQIQHWLNGQLIVSATVGDEQWQARVANSKFADIKDFGCNGLGKIMLTDHSSEVWLRNIEFETK